MKKISFIGAGHMARAIAGGIISKGIVAAQNVCASDVNPQQREEFERVTGARTVAKNISAVSAGDVIVLAVKPFHVAGVCEEIRQGLESRHLVVSICAGITTSYLQQHLTPDVRVVRAMPNTPALIGCGATAVAGGEHASAEDIATALELFNAVGVAIQLPEDKLDLVTGLSGSGPAYVFYFAESLIAAAEKLGLGRWEAELLVKHTLHGAARLALETDRTLAELRAAVTTKGGTTEAGLRALDEFGFSRTIEECVAAAMRRSRELAAQ
ncbi:MAG: pyrroline-5-carboxylate reductase [Candidatus Sumerlaeaceae bacterium]